MTTVEANVSPLLTTKMKRVFAISLSHGSAITNQELRADLFVAFCRESRILGAGAGAVTKTYLQLVWNGYTERVRGMDFQMFLSCMINISFRIFRSTTKSLINRAEDDSRNLEELYERYLDTYVSRFILTVANGTSVDPLRNGWPVYTNIVITHCVRENMEFLFQTFRSHSKPSKNEALVMSKDSFLTLCEIWNIVPQMMSMEDAAFIFDKANTDDTNRLYKDLHGSRPSSGGSSHPSEFQWDRDRAGTSVLSSDSFLLASELEMDEFVDSLLLLALRCFSSIHLVGKYITMQSRVVSFFLHIRQHSNEFDCKPYVPYGETPLPPQQEKHTDAITAAFEAPGAPGVTQPIPTFLMPNSCNLRFGPFKKDDLSNSKSAISTPQKMRRPSARKKSTMMKSSETMSSDMKQGAREPLECVLSGVFFARGHGGLNDSMLTSFADPSSAPHPARSFFLTQGLCSPSSFEDTRAKTRFLVAAVTHFANFGLQTSAETAREINTRIERHRMMRLGETMLQSSPRMKREGDERSEALTEADLESSDIVSNSDGEGGGGEDDAPRLLMVRFGTIAITPNHKSRNRVFVAPPTFKDLAMTLRRYTLLRWDEKRSRFYIKLCMRCPVPVTVSNDGGKTWWGDDFVYTYEDDSIEQEMEAELVEDMRFLFRQFAKRVENDIVLSYSEWKKLKNDNHIMQLKLSPPYITRQGNGGYEAFGPEDDATEDPWFMLFASKDQFSFPQTTINRCGDVVIQNNARRGSIDFQSIAPLSPGRTSGGLTFEGFLLALLWGVALPTTVKSPPDPITILRGMVRQRSVVQNVFSALKQYQSVFDVAPEMPMSRRDIAGPPSLRLKRKLCVGEVDNCNVLVRSLPQDMTTDEIAALFEGFGCKEIELFRKSSSANPLALITFTSNEEATRAINFVMMERIVIRGIPIHVGFSRCTHSLEGDFIPMGFWESLHQEVEQDPLEKRTSLFPTIHTKRKIRKDSRESGITFTPDDMFSDHQPSSSHQSKIIPLVPRRPSYAKLDVGGAIRLMAEKTPRQVVLNQCADMKKTTMHGSMKHPMSANSETKIEVKD